MNPLPANSADSILIFVHIPKTGGTTLRWVLEDQFSVRATLRYYPFAHQISQNDIEALIAQRPQQFRLFCGHVEYGFFHHFQPPARHITLLREPISRSISDFIQYPKGRDAQDIPFHDFDSYLHVLKDIHRDNLQVRMIAGVEDVDNLTTEHLQTAKDNLQNHFVFGLMERFNESLGLFRRVFAWKPLTIISRNRSRKSSSFIPTPEQLIRLQELNRLDSELYDFARSLFESHLQAHSITPENISSDFNQSPFAVTRQYARRALRVPHRRLLDLP